MTTICEFCKHADSFLHPMAPLAGESFISIIGSQPVNTGISIQLRPFDPIYDLEISDMAKLLIPAFHAIQPVKQK